MSGYVTIGYRGKAGEVKNALSHTSDLAVFPRCPIFLSGDQTRLANLVEKQASLDDYYPYSSAPYLDGYRFADFVSMTIFDMQSHESLLGITWLEMASSLRKRNGLFEALVPSVTSVTRLVPHNEKASPRERYSYQTERFDAVLTVEDLFQAAKLPEPPQLLDFATLNVAPGRWKVRSFPATYKGALEFRNTLEAFIPLSSDDYVAWERHLAAWRDRGV